MKKEMKSKKNDANYDIIHFEALGPEATHLEEEISKAIEQNEIPSKHNYLITPDNVQTFLKNNPELLSRRMKLKEKENIYSTV